MNAKRLIDQNRVRARLLLFAAVLLLAACGQGGASSQPTPTPLPTPIVPEKPTYTVERGTVVNTLEFTGRVSPVLEQELFFRTDGFVSDVFFARGDQVQAGDLLAELEIVDLQNRLAQQQVALQTAEVLLAQAEQEVADQLLEAEIDLEKLQLQLEQNQANDSTANFTTAQVRLQQAERQLAEAQETYDNAWDEARDWEQYMKDPTCLPGQGGPVPCTGQPLSERIENDRTSSERALAAAQDNLVVARAEYNDAYANRGVDDIDTQILEKDIELAEHKIEQLKRGVDLLLDLDVEKAQLEIEDIERQIADARLVAPFGGELLSVSIRSGSVAEAFKTVIVLADPSDLETTAELSNEELGQMSVGQIATIRLRSRPEQDFGGTVRQLPYPYGGGTAETEDEDTAVRIAFDDPDVALEMGELATVVIVLEEKQDVLWLPPAALRTFQGRTFVVVQDEDGQRRVDVRVGIESDERVEILEGVEEGQTIVGE
jgi:HlyD family secretion protein